MLTMVSLLFYQEELILLRKIVLQCKDSRLIELSLSFTLLA